MKKILFLFLLFVSCAGFSQPLYQVNNSAGFQYKRFQVDSAQTIPLIYDTTSTPYAQRKLGCIALYCGAADTFLCVWTASSKWKRVGGVSTGGGGTMDSTIFYTNYRADTAWKKQDSINEVQSGFNSNTEDYLEFLNDGKVTLGAEDQTIYGFKAFYSPLTVGQPTASGHAVTKQYADSIAALISDGGGEANLSAGTVNATTYGIANSNGTGVTIAAATSTTAGVQTAAHKNIVDSLDYKYAKVGGNTSGSTLATGTKDSTTYQLRTYDSSLITLIPAGGINFAAKALSTTGGILYYNAAPTANVGYVRQFYDGTSTYTTSTQSIGSGTLPNIRFRLGQGTSTEKRFDMFSSYSTNGEGWLFYSPSVLVMSNGALVGINFTPGSTSVGTNSAFKIAGTIATASTSGGWRGLYISPSVGTIGATSSTGIYPIDIGINTAATGAYATHRSKFRVDTAGIIWSLSYATGSSTKKVIVSDSLGTLSTQTIPDVSNGNTAFSWGNHASAGYELTSSKSTTTTLGTSNSLYPTQNAVKTYVDVSVGITPSIDDTHITTNDPDFVTAWGPNNTDKMGWFMVTNTSSSIANMEITVTYGQAFANTSYPVISCSTTEGHEGIAVTGANASLFKTAIKAAAIGNSIIIYYQVQGN